MDAKKPQYFITTRVKNGKCYISDGKGFGNVALCENRAAAELIITACNAHDHLVAALKAAHDDIKYEVDRGGLSLISDETCRLMTAALTAAGVMLCGSKNLLR
jgi:hypothetical protein